jgi:hypothetical protein
MKYYVLAMAASVALAQSVTNTYIKDLNGQRVQAESVATGDHERTEITQNLNGRRIPMQQTDERVLKQDGNTKVVEKIVRKYDPNGKLASTDRLLIEEQTRPGGSTTRTTTYRTDVNGRMQEIQRETAEVESQGSGKKTETTIERPTINNSFQAVEKRVGVTETSGNTTHEDQTVYGRSENGGYVVTARKVKDSTRAGNQTTEKDALYQAVGNNSQLQLTLQTVSTTATRPDGSESKEVNLYGSSWNGHVGDNQSGPQLREQQIIERGKGSGGVTETLSVRRPTASDPNKLGPLTKISETVCTGKCQ